MSGVLCHRPGVRNDYYYATLTAGILFATVSAIADTNFVAAQLETVTNQYSAYAQVEPVASLPVRVAQSGLIEGVTVLPGNPVQAGQKLAELGGPEIKALLVQDEANVTSAQSNLLACRQSLAIQQQQLASHIATHQMILQSESAAAQAQATFDTARAQLEALQDATALKAPVDGTVLALSAADGERVNAGDAILTIQPRGKLWLRAVYYGNDIMALKPGMTGEFFPAGNGDAISIKVCSVFGALTTDGGESIGLLPLNSPNWLNGQSGTVTLNGPVQRLVAIPTESLILDQGQWWVLIHTEKGDKPQAVTPGQNRGWQTFIKEGLQPGDKVVTDGAYLEFHQGLSQKYQSDD